MRLAAPVILVLALAGCADSTPGYVVGQEQLRQVKMLQARYDSDLDSPSFASLAGKVDLHQIYLPGEDPCAGLIEDSFPTAQESVALKRWAHLHAAWIIQYETIAMEEPNGSSELKSVADLYDAVMDNGLRSQNVLISALAEGHLTYCQFATENKKLTEGFLKDAGSLARKFWQVRTEDYERSHPGSGPTPYQR